VGVIGKIFFFTICNKKSFTCALNPFTREIFCATIRKTEALASGENKISLRNIGIEDIKGGFSLRREEDRSEENIHRE